MILDARTQVEFNRGMKMKTIATYIWLGILAAVIIFPAASQEDNHPVVALMINVDVPVSPSEAQIREAEINLHKIYNEIRSRDQTATLFLNQDVTSSRIRLTLAQYTVLSNMEFAVSGRHSNDSLSTMPLSKQQELIKKSIDIAKASKVCGLTEVNVLGFFPPGFDQNEDTYQAIDKLGITYDAGFQAGLISAPGHEEDVWPYQVEGYDFYALPISTINLSGKKMPLYDLAMMEAGISDSACQEHLVTKFEEASSKDEPEVILLSTSLSSGGEYLEALKSFLDYAKSMNATFANARDLISISTGSPLDIEDSTVCTTCGQDQGEAISINVINESISENESMVSANMSI